MPPICYSIIMQTSEKISTLGYSKFGTFGYLRTTYRSSLNLKIKSTNPEINSLILASGRLADMIFSKTI